MATKAKALRATVRPRDVAGHTRRQLAADLVEDLWALNRKLKELDKRLRAAVEATGRKLTDIKAVGVATVARVLGDVRHVTGEHHVAAYTANARPRPPRNNVTVVTFPSAASGIRGSVHVRRRRRRPVHAIDTAEEQRMKFGIVGLGRMGLSLGQLAADRGHDVVAWDPDESARESANKAGMHSVHNLEDVPAALSSPRVILMWVPHGKPVDANLEKLLPDMKPDDVVADCGNSFWEESKARHDRVKETGVHFLDIGTSGGISDAPGWDGAAFMAGGPREGFDIVSPLLEDMAVDKKAVHYVGPSPSGHFVKLVHNAIEFGMVQAIAEGVEMLRGFDHDLDLAGLFEHWNHGTVIRSWLVELMGKGLADGGIGLADDVPPDPTRMSTYVEDTDEVKWVVKWAIDHDIPVPVTGMSQQMLMAYRDLDWPAAKSVALLRNQYGGHPIHRADEDDPRT